jgi:signal transduction histidine kinase
MKIKGFLPVVIFLLWPFLNLAQENKYITRQFTSAEGLPQNSVKSIAIDSSSFVWLTTEGGLVRYDGRNFLTFNHSTMPEITGDRFQSLFYDYNFNLLATNDYGSLVIIRNNKPELVSSNNHPLTGALYMQGAFPDFQQYYAIQEERIKGLGEKWISYPANILPISNNGFLTSGRNCIYRYEGAKLIDSIHAVEHTGNLFMLDSLVYSVNKFGAHLYNIQSRKFSSCFISEPMKGLLVKAGDKIIWNYKNHRAYFKSNQNLYEISASKSGDSIFINKILSPLPDNCKITSVVFHPETSTYFIGTDTRGFFTYQLKSIHNLPNTGSMATENNSFYSQAVIDSHHVFTTYGLIIGLDTSYQATPTQFNYEAILNSRENKIYLSIQDSVFVIKPDNKKKVNKLGIKTGLVSCYFEDADTIYFGSDYGLGIICNDSARLIITRTSLNINTRPIQILKDSKGVIWVATCSGLMKYSELFSNGESIKSLDGICFRSLFQWGEHLFAGSYGNGYYIIHEGKVVKMPIDKKSRLAQIHSFQVDDHNFLWFSTNNGLFMASMEEIMNYFNNQKSEIYYYLINQEDGIKNPEFNGGCSPSVVHLKNGYFSYPSFGGLVWFHPDSIKPIFPGNKIFFENLRIDQRDLIHHTNVHLAPDFTSFSVDVTIPYWGKPENLSVEYRLNDSNGKWEKLEPEEKRIRFGNLSSGQYNLEVRVRTGFGKDNFSFQQLAFTVDEHFYEKGWVQLLAVSGLIGLTLLVFRLYSQNIIRQNQLLEKNINARTTELKESNELLHENLLKLQESEEELSSALTLRDKLMSIISHDLITPVRFITMSSRLARSEAKTNPKEELIDVLREIEATTIRIHDNAQNVLDWIRFQSKGMKAVKSNVAIHDLIEEVVVLYKPIAEAGQTAISNLSPEEDIIISDPQILKIVIQNILNNAVKFTKSGNISIVSVTKGKDYRIQVIDTGPGFSEAAMESIRQLRSGEPFRPFTTDSSEDGTHLGFQIIHELLRFLNGDFQITSNSNGSTVEITLYNCLQE